MVQGGDGPLQLLDVLQRQPKQQGVVGGEAAAQRLAQRRELGAQLAPGQVGQDHGVALAGKQRGQHRPARGPLHVGGDRAEPDRGVLQGLVDPLGLGGVGLDEPLAVAGQVAQLADDRWRHEAAAQQPALQQLAQPRRVADVGFAARQDLDVAGVDQQQRQPALLQHLPAGLPVGAGRLHHHLGDALGGEPVGQRLKTGGERLVGADLLAPPAASVSGHAGAGDDLVFADVKRGAALVEHLHGRPPPGCRMLRRPAGPTEETMLKGVLAADSSRCREGPRISLNNGLSRTKESRAWPGTPDSHPSRRPPAMGV